MQSSVQTVLAPACLQTAWQIFKISSSLSKGSDLFLSEFTKAVQNNRTVTLEYEFYINAIFVVELLSEICFLVQ